MTTAPSTRAIPAPRPAARRITASSSSPPVFRGQTRVARSRAVNTALAGEYGPPETGGMHALALTLRTPEEHAAAIRPAG